MERALDYSVNAQLIAENLHILSHMVREVCEKKYLENSAPSFITNTQFTILRILSNTDSMTVTELAELLQVSKPAASKNIDILFRNKLVNRVTLETDRRTTSLTLQPKGKKIVNDYDHIRLMQQCSVLDNFSEKEQVQFASLIEKYIMQCITDRSFDSEVVCLQCSGRLGEQCSVGKHAGNCHFKVMK